MSVGTISSFDGLRTSHGISGVAHKPNSLTGGSDITTDLSKLSSTAYTFGTSGLDVVNQVVRVIFTATKNTTTTMNLATGFTNVVGDTSATFSLVKGWQFELLTTAQDATNGTAITGNVTIQPGALNPVTTSPLGTTNHYVMAPGDKWVWESHGASGGATIASGSAQNIDFVNADASVDGHFLVIIWGLK